jgi:hypothetical protein
LRREGRIVGSRERDNEIEEILPLKDLKPFITSDSGGGGRAYCVKGTYFIP